MAEDYSICVVCSGNICRSPLGAAVLTDALARAGLEERVSVCSAGTGSWHVGEGADHRACAVAPATGSTSRSTRRACSRPTTSRVWTSSSRSTPVTCAPCATSRPTTPLATRSD
nr:hypothetical protein [Pseudactinotalea suaedae]